MVLEPVPTLPLHLAESVVRKAREAWQICQGRKAAFVLEFWSFRKSGECLTISTPGNKKQTNKTPSNVKHFPMFTM